jgi:hypothetical protein
MMKGAIKSTILIIGSLIVLILVIIAILISTMPMLQYGSCWGPLISAVKELSIDANLRGRAWATFPLDSSCVLGVYFLNRNELTGDKFRGVACPVGKESYIIAKPQEEAKHHWFFSLETYCSGLRKGLDITESFERIEGKEYHCINISSPVGSDLFKLEIERGEKCVA